MLNSWFGNKLNRHSRQRQTPVNLQANFDGPSDASSISPSLQTPGNPTSASNMPLDEVHAHINDPSVYTPTPSLIQSAEKDAETLRTSDIPTASLDAPTTDHRDKQPSAPDRAEKTPFTPQDAIIAQVFGKSVSPPALPATEAAVQPLVSLTSDSPPAAPATSSHVRPVTIHDPFSGLKLAEHAPMSPSASVPGDASGLGTSIGGLPAVDDDQKLWSSLERILELQAEIAGMHADVEGVGRGSGNVHAQGGTSGAAAAGVGGRVGPRKRSRRGQTLAVGDEELEEHISGLAISDILTDHSEGGDEDDTLGYGKRRRDEEFEKLAEQFKQRKAAIGGIMDKLDELSTALKTFHALPPPLFDLAVSPSRTDTMSSRTSSPLHVHPPPPSSPLSSISSSQAAPITPTNVSFPLSVPPISTLTLLTPSEFDPNAPSTVGLPPTASPRIMPRTPHVESPADMNPAQSIFQGAP